MGAEDVCAAWGALRIYSAGLDVGSAVAGLVGPLLILVDVRFFRRPVLPAHLFPPVLSLPPNPQQLYHPNFDLEGNICLNILREDWKPVLTITAIVYGLNFLFLVSPHLFCGLRCWG